MKREEKRKQGKLIFVTKKQDFFLQCIYAQMTYKFEGLKVCIS